MLRTTHPRYFCVKTGKFSFTELEYMSLEMLIYNFIRICQVSFKECLLKFSAAEDDTLFPQMFVTVRFLKIWWHYWDIFKVNNIYLNTTIWMVLTLEYTYEINHWIKIMNTFIITKSSLVPICNAFSILPLPVSRKKKMTCFLKIWIIIFN